MTPVPAGPKGPDDSPVPTPAGPSRGSQRGPGDHVRNDVVNELQPPATQGLPRVGRCHPSPTSNKETGKGACLGRTDDTAGSASGLSSRLPGVGAGARPWRAGPPACLGDTATQPPRVTAGPRPSGAEQSASRSPVSRPCLSRKTGPHCSPVW